MNDSELAKTIEAGLTVLIALGVRIADGTNGTLQDSDLKNARALYRKALANAREGT